MRLYGKIGKQNSDSENRQEDRDGEKVSGGVDRGTSIVHQELYVPVKAMR